MALWKRNKEKQPGQATKGKNGIPVKDNRPQSVLLWIDAVHQDLPARVIRGVAIAHAFRNAGIEKVTLACLESANLPGETDRLHIQWMNSRPEGKPITFGEIVKTTAADLVIADSLTPPRLPAEYKESLLIMLAEQFSPPLLESEWVNSLLLPGYGISPDFETLNLLPSRLADCFHGLDYVALGNDYFLSNEPVSENHVLIMVSGASCSESIPSLLETVRTIWKGTVIVLADVLSHERSRIQEAVTGETLLMIDPPFSERRSAIRSASLILATPFLNLYEALALRKPLVLLPRTETEKKLGRLIQEKKGMRVIPFEEANEPLKRCLEELLQSEDERKKVGNGTGDSIPATGAKNLVDVLLARFERSRNRLTAV